MNVDAFLLNTIGVKNRLRKGDKQYLFEGLMQIFWGRVDEGREWVGLGGGGFRGLVF